MSEQYVSNDEARELQDILRTLTPSGTALKTSARELVEALILAETELVNVGKERDKLQDELAHETWERR